MATTFDVTTYPLETSSRFKPELGTTLDRMSDGTVKLRQTTSIKPAKVTCVFTPQNAASSATFLAYLETNAATEFDIVHNGRTYRGYIDGKSIEPTVTDGILHWWTFDLLGRLV